MANTQRQVDFLPQFSMSGDFYKVGDDTAPRINAIIIQLQNLLNMPKGGLVDQPSVGCLELVQSLYYSSPDDRPEIIDTLNRAIGFTLPNPVAVALLPGAEGNDEDFALHITISGMKRFKADITRETSGFVKIVNIASL